MPASALRWGERVRGALKPHARRAGATVAAGTLACLGFAGFDLWPLCFVALVPLFFVLDDDRIGARGAVCLGWTCGTVAHAGATYWLAQTLARFGGHPAPVAAGIALLGWAWDGGRYAVFAWLVWRARRHAVGWWIAPFAWAAVETAYPLVLPSQLAASLHAVPWLVQLASLGGATLVSMLIVLVNVAVFSWGVHLLRGTGQRPTRPWAVAVALTCAAVAWGHLRLGALDDRIAAAPALRVGLVQTNVAPEEKRANVASLLARHLALSRTLEAEGKLDLLVWPETALPGALDPEAPVVQLRAQGEANAAPPAAPLQTPLLFGALTLRTRGPAAGLYNSAALVRPDGAVLGRYDKRRLVPLAEAMPFVDRFPALRSFAPDANQLREGRARGPLVLGRTRLSALICYEDILADRVRESMRDEDPQLLVNLTNDAWFGESTAPRIHLALAQLRAVEAGRTLVRATHSGTSAVIDPAGRVIAEAPPFAPAALVADAPLIGGTTPFVRLGNWPGWLGLVMTFAWCLARPARRRATLPRDHR